MKKYDALSSYAGNHKIKVTFQDDEYKGHIVYKLGGNYRGREALDFDVALLDVVDIEYLEENTANLKLEGDYYFSLQLSNGQGDICSYGDIDSKELNKMIVCIEIVEFKEV